MSAATLRDVEPVSTPSSTATGTVRTAWNGGVAAAVVSLVLYLLDRFADWEIDASDPLVVLVLIPATGATLGVVYRLSRALADRWPAFGYVLFAIPRPPTYPVDPAAVRDA